MVKKRNEVEGNVVAAFRSPLLDWYRANRRPFPWRQTPDPYRILLSEVILQQTRTDQGLPYYERFVERFPDLGSLATAEIEEVLMIWEGLGYYARARNLHAAARLVCERHDGALPADYETLITLPGIGPYTAAAVGSIAFGEARPAVDGNVLRVLARVFAIGDDVRKGATWRRIESIASQLLDPRNPGTFNQAVMELGALVCTPVAPACRACPLGGVCRGLARGDPTRFPFRSPSAPKPHHDIGVGILLDRRRRVLLRRRPFEGLLGGLWEFPGERIDGDELPADAARRALEEAVGTAVEMGDPIARIPHAFSHFRITLHAFQARLPGGARPPRARPPLRWVVPDGLAALPFSRSHRRLAEKAGF